MQQSNTTKQNALVTIDNTDSLEITNNVFNKETASIVPTDQVHEMFSNAITGETLTVFQDADGNYAFSEPELERKLGYAKYGADRLLKTIRPTNQSFDKPELLSIYLNGEYEQIKVTDPKRLAVYLKPKFDENQSISHNSKILRIMKTDENQSLTEIDENQLVIDRPTDCRSMKSDENQQVTEFSKDDDVVIEIPGQGIKYLTESQMYQFVLNSEAKNAKEFKDWVTNEVLPRIRKNGGYTMKEELLSDDNQMEVAKGHKMLADFVSRELHEHEIGVRDNQITVLNNEVRELRVDNIDLKENMNMLTKLYVSSEERGKRMEDKMDKLLDRAEISENRHYIAATSSRNISYILEDYFIESDYEFSCIDYRNLAHMFHKVLELHLHAVKRVGNGWVIVRTDDMSKYAVQLDINTQKPRIMYTNEVTSSLENLINNVAKIYDRKDVSRNREKAVSYIKKNLAK